MSRFYATNPRAGYRSDDPPEFKTDNKVFISPTEMQQAKTKNGGYKSKQMKMFGKNGTTESWKYNLTRFAHPREKIEAFIALGEMDNEQVVASQSEAIKSPEFVVPNIPIPWKDQYLHPNWQKVRLVILSRDKFRCRTCGDKNSQLHVHHSTYENCQYIWDVDFNTLITLCDACHTGIHEMFRQRKQGAVVQHV
jgi:hypothetical protein